MLFLPAPSVLSPGNSPGECSMPLPHRKMLLKLLQSYGGILGVPASGGSCKVWGTRCTVELFTAEGSWEFEIPFWLHTLVLGMGFVAGACLRFSYPFCYGDFLIHLMCRSSSASLWVSFRVLAACVAERLVRLWRKGLSEPPVTLLVSSRSVRPWNKIEMKSLCYSWKGQKYFMREMSNRNFKMRIWKCYFELLLHLLHNYYCSCPYYMACFLILTFLYICSSY